jgi:hypothetical protein
VVVSAANVMAIDGRFRPTSVAADAASGEQDWGNFGFQMQRNRVLVQERGAAELCRWAVPASAESRSFGGMMPVAATRLVPTAERIDTNRAPVVPRLFGH